MSMVCCGLGGPAAYQDRISKQSGEKTAKDPHGRNADSSLRARDSSGIPDRRH